MVLFLTSDVLVSKQETNNARSEIKIMAQGLIPWAIIFTPQYLGIKKLIFVQVAHRGMIVHRKTSFGFYRAAFVNNGWTSLMEMATRRRVNR